MVPGALATYVDSQADTRAAVQLLGHAPKFTLEQGLRRTLEWYSKDANERATVGATSR